MSGKPRHSGQPLFSGVRVDRFFKLLQVRSILWRSRQLAYGIADQVAGKDRFALRSQEFLTIAFL